MAIRGGFLVNARPKRIALEATIIRADGTRESLGVIDYWHRNPLKRWAWQALRAWNRKDF